MDRLTTADLRRLMGRPGGMCVSLFMPTDRTGVSLQEGEIRFKNLLDEAERRLTGRGMRAPEARDLLHPARALERDGHFWKRQGDGLALFLTADGMEYWRLPVTMRELVFAGERRHTKPLLPVVTGNGRYVALVLHRNSVALFEGTRDGLASVDLHGIPRRLAELLDASIEPTADLQSRVVSVGHHGTPRTMVSGSGGNPGGLVAEHKVRALEYFQMLDKALHEHLGNALPPLVIAGVDELLPIYREAAHHLRPAAQLPVGQSRVDERELHRQCWALIEPIFTKAPKSWAARFVEGQGTGRTSSDVSTVLRAAREGRVEAAFVSLDSEAWGGIDPETDDPEPHQQRRMEDDDLLDVIAAETALKGGHTFALRDADAKALGLPPPVAAVLRY